MWTIEKREETEGKRATRWVPVPGVRCGTREEAAKAAREAVLGELRVVGQFEFAQGGAVGAL
jgi:hypothetical protein